MQCAPLIPERPLAAMPADWSDEETSHPLKADDRYFYSRRCEL
jgi:hypothetical protein